MTVSYVSWRLMRDVRDYSIISGVFYRWIIHNNAYRTKF